MGLFDFFKRKQNTTAARDNIVDLVEVAPGLQVPRFFAAHWPEIEKSKIEFIAVQATAESVISPHKSSFGNYPCIPKSFAYPVDKEGRYLFPLAQINFAETPSLPGYPTEGYLQFYISVSDDVYGINFDDAQQQDNFRVVYFSPQELNDPVTDFSFLQEVMASDRVPVPQPYLLSFEIRQEYIGPQDAYYERTQHVDLRQLITEQYPAQEDQLEDLLFEHFSNNGHKIGGYAYFTQTDPRYYQESWKDYILLFQMDSVEDIMWGDVGVANFFIHPDDLAKKDFSKVAYNWDCS